MSDTAMSGTRSLGSIAQKFVLMAIQEWGQSEAERIAAVQAILDAAGFDATATCGPVFGGIWPTECIGPMGSEATIWLKKLTDTLPRGKFEREEQHIREMVSERMTVLEREDRE